MSRYLALALMAFPLLAWPADELAQKKEVRVQLYSVVCPATRGWVRTTNKAAQTVSCEKRDSRDKSSISLTVTPANTAAMYRTVHTVQWLADDLRRREKAAMIALGVNRGLYELENFRQFEAEVAGKQGYAGRYMTRKQDVVSDGYYFLYFPKDFEKTSIAYQFHYSFARDAEDTREPNLRPFYYLIQTFKLR